MMREERWRERGRVREGENDVERNGKRAMLRQIKDGESGRERESER